MTETRTEAGDGDDPAIVNLLQWNEEKAQRIATLTAQLHDAEAERDRMREALEKAKIYAERRHRELWNPGNNFEPSASPAALAVAEDLAIIHAALAPEARAALSKGKP